MRAGNRVMLAALLTVTAVLAGCSINPATGRRQLRLIDTQQEIAIGDQAAPEFEKQFGGKIPDETLQIYIRQVGGRLALASERKDVSFVYALLASNVPNAFALPGGKIYITAGLMRRITNERQLASVLGHETGHVAAAHNVDALQRQMGAELLAEIAAAAIGGSRGEAAKAGAQVATGMLNLRYSRKDEYEADVLGLRYMTKAAYNPWGMVELLTTLKELSGSEPGSFGEMFQTHPLTSKRIEQVQQEIQTNAAYRSFSSAEKDPRSGQFVEMRVVLESEFRGKG